MKQRNIKCIWQCSTGWSQRSWAVLGDPQSHGLVEVLLHWLEWVWFFTEVDLNAVVKGNSWVIRVCYRGTKQAFLLSTGQLETQHRKKRRLYNERRQSPWTFENAEGFFALHFSFPAKSGQLLAGETWQSSICLWVINSEKKGSFKTSFVYSVSFCLRCYKQSKLKVSGIIPISFSCHSEMCSNTDFPETILHVSEPKSYKPKY